MLTTIEEADSVQEYAKAQADHFRRALQRYRGWLLRMLAEGVSLFRDAQGWPWDAPSLVAAIRRLSRGLDVFDRAASVPASLPPASRIAALNGIWFRQ